MGEGKLQSRPDTISGINLPGNLIMAGVPGNGDGRGVGFPRLQGMLLVKQDKDDNPVIVVEVHKIVSWRQGMSAEEEEAQDSYLLTDALYDLAILAQSIFKNPVFHFVGESVFWTVVDINKKLKILVPANYEGDLK